MVCLKRVLCLILCYGGLYTDGSQYLHPQDYTSKGESPLNPKLMTPVQEFFEVDSPRIITAVVGYPATLPCQFKHLDSPVAVYWVRKRDLCFLTWGIHTLTQDDRINVLHQDIDVWDLVIWDVKKEDNGTYECLVETDPLMILDIVLKVSEDNDKETTASIDYEAYDQESPYEEPTSTSSDDITGYEEGHYIDNNETDSVIQSDQVSDDGVTSHGISSVSWVLLSLLVASISSTQFI